MRPAVALLAALWLLPQADDRGVLDPNTLNYLAVPELPVTVPATHCPPDRVLIMVVTKPNGPVVAKCLPDVLLSDPER